MSFFSLVAADVRAMVLDRGRGRIVYALSVVAKVIVYPRIQTVILFRVAHEFQRRRLVLVSQLIQAIGLFLSGAEIHPAAQIGPGFCLVHSSGVVIGDRVIIGPRFICFHGVTVGDSGRHDGLQPTVGEGVNVSAGAKLVGGIHVGDGALIGANAVVLQDVPAGGVAVGVPARVVKINEVAAATRSAKTVA